MAMETGMRIAGVVQRLAALLAFAVASLQQVHAQGLGHPAGKVILTVTGEIARTNATGKASFDLSLLDALPQHGFVTSTIWTSGQTTYSGVLLVDLLAAVGAQGATVVGNALNDYRIRIPVAEITEEAPLLAYRADGVPMSVREKGPIWLIYPFDSDEQYRTEQNYSRSIWQLNRIEITD
jgi:hypothetical protein